MHRQMEKQYTMQSNSGCQFTNSRGTTSGKILVAKKSSNNEEMNKQIILLLNTVTEQNYFQYNDQRHILNPSAWGHLNPSSYCDVGRLFYGVFKLWSKLQRKK